MAIFAGASPNLRGIKYFDLLFCHNHSINQTQNLFLVWAKSVIWAVLPPAWFCLVFSVLETHTRVKTGYRYREQWFKGSFMSRYLHNVYKWTYTLTTHSLCVQHRMKDELAVQHCQCLNNPELTASSWVKPDIQLTSPVIPFKQVGKNSLRNHQNAILYIDTFRICLDSHMFSLVFLWKIFHFNYLGVRFFVTKLEPESDWNRSNISDQALQVPQCTQRVIAHEFSARRVKV